MMKLKIKKGDSVVVITGSDKGKKGTVLEIDRKNLRLKVEGVRVMTHFDKREGLLKKEGFIDYSNVKSANATKETKAKKSSKSKSA